MIDPQAKAILDVINADNGLPLGSVEDRAAKMASLQKGVVPETVGQIENCVIPVKSGEIAARIYTPEGKGKSPWPMLVYFHGGGFVQGDLDGWDVPLRALTNSAQCKIVSIAYRLAPKHKFPTAPEDCYQATQWVAANAASLGGDPGRIAVAGDSVGGNLAAVVCLLTKERGGASLSFQILMYPITDMAGDYPSEHQFAKGYFITFPTDPSRYFRGLYLRSLEDIHDFRMSPLLADLEHLPPAFVVTAGNDPLHDQGEAYAQKLAAAGVRVKYHSYDGMIHGFFGMAALLDKGKELIGELGDFCRQEFSR